MEQIIQYIQAHSSEANFWSEKELAKLVQWFREKGVTVMALEELLKFYSAPRAVYPSVDEDAFISPSQVFATSNDVLRQEIKSLGEKNNNLLRQNEKLEHKVKTKSQLCNILYVVITVLVLLLLIFIII